MVTPGCGTPPPSAHGARAARPSVPPQSLETAAVHPAVALRIRHLAMAQVGGERQRIETLVDQLEAAGVTQEVRVDIVEPGLRRSFPEQL